MKIVLINDHVSPWKTSSVASIVESLSWQFRQKGHTVKLLTAHQERGKGIIREGDVTLVPSIPSRYFPYYQSVFSASPANMIGEILAEEKPDVVHAHNIHTYMTYPTLKAVRGHCPRVYITFHDVMSISYGRLNTQRYLSHLDTRLTLADHLERASWSWNPVRNSMIRSLILQNTTKRFAVSAALQKALETNGITGSEVVHNGIDLARWEEQPTATAQFRETYGLEGRATILFGGRLSLDKGIGPLIEALKRIRSEVPSVLLLVVGELRRWERIVSASDRAMLRDHCKAIGWLTEEEMQPAYFASDIVTSPSLCLDCFPNMNLEAMAAAKPVVGTIFGGTQEAVVDGVTGFVCDPRDVPLFASRLTKLLTDKDLRASMGAAGRARVEKEFTIEKQADAYLRAYTA